MEAAPLRLVLTQLLALTNGESVNVEKLRGSMRITSEAFDNVLSQLSEADIITVEGDHISLSLDQRLQLASKAVEVGADFESVSRSLGWKEFEEISAKVLEENLFRVLRRFRFTADGRRWEIDLLAVRAPYLVCAECKHWGKGMGNQTARGIVETHLEKTEVLSRFLESLKGRIGIKSWSKVTLVPMVLTLSATPMEIYRRVPSVSVLALPSFITEFDGQLERLAIFRVELTPAVPTLKQMKIGGRIISNSKRARHRL
jgi:hypothetical protein